MPVLLPCIQPEDSTKLSTTNSMSTVAPAAAIFGVVSGR